jgi:HEAT repeat protein
MPSELPSRMRNIAGIFDSAKSISRSKLASLSGLNNEELELFKEMWPNTDSERRQEIVSQLVHLSEADLKLDVSSVFVFLLRDSDETIRVQAVAGLEGEDNYVLIKPLVQALKEDTSTKVRAAAAVALGKFALQGELDNLPSLYREKVYNALLETLENKTESTEVKCRALEAISPFSLSQVRELIETACHADDIKLRTSAICAMGRNCDLAWLPTLLIELNNNDPEIRYEAARACGELGAEEAVPHLLKMITDEDQKVREAAIKALGEIGNEQAKDALGKLIKNPQPGIRDAAKSALKEIQHCENTLSLQL